MALGLEVAEDAPSSGYLSGQECSIGCGNGYFGWRALQAGAREVIGIDPSILFLYSALRHPEIFQRQKKLGATDQGRGTANLSAVRPYS